jgi:uncharacterized membrane protein YfcA
MQQASGVHLVDPLSVYPLAIWIVLIATGAVIGLLAGFLGIGGGIVSVPVLLQVFASMGMADATALPLAVGTAHTNILIASLSAVAAHRYAGTIDRSLVRAWLPALVAGVVIGLVLEPMVAPRILTLTFAVIAAALGVKMAVGDRLVLGPRQPQGPLAQMVPAAVGALAAALGIGGGTLSTPVLSLFRFPIQRAVGAGALFNLIIALPATATFLAEGWATPGRPADAVGEVSVFAVVALSLPALFVAPWAARWSSRAPIGLMRNAFAVCLAVIAIRMLWAP